MIDFRAAAFPPQPVAGLVPVWKVAVLLTPMHDGRFIAPMRQIAHGAAVCTAEHEILHGGLVGPGRGGPEGVAGFAKELRFQIAFGAAGLA